ncbi:MAG: flagellar hook-length control protein FliK [Terriglobales bacterium]
MTAAAAPPAEALPGASKQVTVALHNDTLGAVELRATLQPGGLVAAIQAARPDTQAALLRDLPVLQQALSDHNIRVGSVTVSSGPANHGGGSISGGGANPSGGHGGFQPTAQGGGRQGQAPAQSARPSARSWAPAASPPAGGEAAGAAAGATLPPGRLSVRV